MKTILYLLLSSAIVLQASEVDLKEGKRIYDKTCVSCHGENGKVNKGVSFIVNPRDLSKTILYPEQLYKIIRDGAHFYGASSDIMPSFKSVLDEKELRSVTHYIVEEFGLESKKKVDKLMSEADKIDPTKEAKMLKRGKKIYNRNCSWCHGIDGTGDGEATRNPEMSIFPYDLTKSLFDKDQMFLYTKYGGKYWGTDKADMPSWSRKYDDFTIHSVTKYIKEVLVKEKDAK
jgi:mono/diheme cytochrome c family protein